MFDQELVDRLTEISRRLRRQVLKMVYEAPGGGHIGGAFSVVDILATLYFSILQHRPWQPDWSGRDRLIFSKGHCSLALYSALCESGYFESSLLETYCRDGGTLDVHPRVGSVPGIEWSTGSLGHGLSAGNGIALANRMDGRLNRVFVVMSDGELNEGSVWESFMFAAQHKLENLVAVVDFNKLISLDQTEAVLSIEPLHSRLESFGWGVRRIDGHDFQQLLTALNDLPAKPGKPTAVIADTVKGKGVSFMEGKFFWHVRELKDEEYEQALRELGD